jgi:hypothetical protein
MKKTKHKLLCVLAALCSLAAWGQEPIQLGYKDSGQWDGDFRRQYGDVFKPNTNKEVYVYCDSQFSETLRLVYRLAPDTNVLYSPYRYNPSNTRPPRVESKLDWIERNSKYWPYRFGTNSALGPMLLRDASGNTLTNIRPEFNRLASYPDSYSLSNMTRLLEPLRKISIDGHELPVPLMKWPLTVPARSNEVYFTNLFVLRRPVSLERYFNITNNGEYMLTIYPKIYRATPTNEDLYQRLDLEPITVPIKWNTKWNNK